ncbi:hypothetical protein [Lacrimispora sp. 38-1]|uniref:hypothetical protein n=1 Tax=Lacrimispora sp. 38-1 TaxID=3125778 RepID=UPI003CE8D01C
MKSVLKKIMITALAGIVLTAILLISACNTKTTGWVQSNGKWYYYDEKGDMAKNTVVEGHKLGTDGAMVESQVDEALNMETVSMEEQLNQPDGWYINKGEKEPKWHYIKDHAYVTGWLNLEGSWFYLDDQGAMIHNTTIEIEGKDYIFSEAGICTNKE